MKITQIRSFSVQDEDGRGYMIVRVDTDAGHHGLGEVGIRNWGRAINEAIEHLSEFVIGADPWSTEKLWQEMFRSGFFPADKVYTCAISAIDIALWDIKGKSIDKPVYRLLGGPVRNKVVCYPHVQGSEIPDVVESAKGLVGQGWKFLRWHNLETSPYSPDMNTVFDPLASARKTIESFAAVRDAVSAEIFASGMAAITAALLALNDGEEGQEILGSVLNTPGITAVNSATHLASYSDAISNIPGIQQYFAESYEQTG